MPASLHFAQTFARSNARGLFGGIVIATGLADGTRAIATTKVTTIKG